MNVNRILQIQNQDALSTFRKFLRSWWKQVGVTAMLAPIEQPESKDVVVQVILGPDEVAAVNPFAPLMSSNIAAAVPQFIREFPTGRLAVILRPCELRTLVELDKRQRLFPGPRSIERDEERLITIAVDCLGTLPAAEYTRRVQGQGAGSLLAETLAGAIDGSTLPTHYRTSCRICTEFAPQGADFAFGTIGIVDQGYILVIADDEAADEQLSLARTTNGLATEAQVSHREVALEAEFERRSAQTHALLNAHPTEYRDFSSLLACIARCTLCADCLDACPLYEGELEGMLGVSRSTPGRGRPLLPELVSLSRWLSSCSGCGMCEEACLNHVPLSLLTYSVSRRLRQELHYVAGNPAQTLPWRSR